MSAPTCRLSAVHGNEARYEGLEKNQIHLQATALISNSAC